MMIDIGLVVLRVVVGALLLGHGLRKLAGWFDGPGLDDHRQTVASLGYRWPRPLAWLHGVVEAVAGVLLIAGFLTPVAMALVLGVMLNAILAVHAGHGLWNDRGGLEYPLVMAASATAIGFAGPGAFAVDAALGWQVNAVAPVLAALALGLIGGWATFATRQRPTESEPETGRRAPLEAA